MNPVFLQERLSSRQSRPKHAKKRHEKHPHRG
jgi:hypothetical protein